VVIPPGEVKLINVGFSCAIPEGYEIQIRPRSGLALNNYISVLNTPGTIDSNYRGLVMVILFNFGKYDYKVEPSDRIAQGVVCKLPDVELVDYSTVTAELKEFWNNQQKISERGSKGFGSSGKR
jgi:dUTP pyrophosphatase